MRTGRNNLLPYNPQPKAVRERSRLSADQGGTWIRTTMSILALRKMLFRGLSLATATIVRPSRSGLRGSLAGTVKPTESLIDLRDKKLPRMSWTSYLHTCSIISNGRFQKSNNLWKGQPQSTRSDCNGTLRGWFPQRTPRTASSILLIYSTTQDPRLTIRSSTTICSYCSMSSLMSPSARLDLLTTRFVARSCLRKKTESTLDGREPSVGFVNQCWIVAKKEVLKDRIDDCTRPSRFGLRRVVAEGQPSSSMSFEELSKVRSSFGWILCLNRHLLQIDPPASLRFTTHAH